MSGAFKDGRCRWMGAVTEADVRSYFDARVERREADECWLWIGPLRTTKEVCNYGDIHLRRRRGGSYRSLAHRVSWLLHRGDIPDGLLVLHRCDVPACVNPSHLFLGEHADNAIDKARKGRSYRPAGEKAHAAKFTDDAVRSIKRRFAEGATNKALAAEYGVTLGCIWCIRRGKTWTHV